MNDESLKAFLVELTALSKKHGMVIGACGCCGSPFVTAEMVTNDKHYVATILSDRQSADSLELVSIGSELPGEVR